MEYILKTIFGKWTALFVEPSLLRLQKVFAVLVQIGDDASSSGPAAFIVGIRIAGL